MGSSSSPHHPSENSSAATDAADLDLSVVVPVYNEVEALPELIRRLRETLDQTEWSYEVLLVDDGSSDGTSDYLHDSTIDSETFHHIRFTKNYGQSAAMTAGYHASRGRYVASLDGDLQNPPEEIPKVVSRLIEADADLVCGWRKNRQDNWGSRKLPSRLANRLIANLTGVKINDYGCSLKAYRGEFVRDLVLYGDLHRFIPVLLHFRGARIEEVVVDHSPRTVGKSKYGIGRTPRVFLDLCLMLFFQSFFTRPIQLFGRLGLITFGIGFFIECYLVWVKLGLGEDIGQRPLLILGVLLITCGLILFGFGIIAEMITRVYFEATGKNIFYVRKPHSSSRPAGESKSESKSSAP